MMRPITAAMRDVLVRLDTENAGLGIPLEASPVRRELVARRLISSRPMKSGHRSRYTLTHEGAKALREAKVRDE